MTAPQHAAAPDAGKAQGAHTPQCDALSTSIYNDSCAAAGDVPGYLGHEWTPEEAYGAALDLAKKLEAERDRLRAALAAIDISATHAFKTMSKDIDDWKEDVEVIQAVARAALARAKESA